MPSPQGTARGEPAEPQVAAREDAMFQTTAKLMNWASIPLLLTGSIFSSLAGEYEYLAGLLIWAGASIAVQTELRSRHYLLATGFGVIMLIFAPISLIARLFLFLAAAGVAACSTLLVVGRRQPARAV